MDPEMLIATDLMAENITLDKGLFHYSPLFRRFDHTL
jgi:hypothetical protein